MAATISPVTSSRPEGLLEAAGQQATSIAAINAQICVQQGAMAELGSNWEGSAATAAQISTSLVGGDLESTHVYAVEGISGTGSDAVVTLRNPWGPSGVPPVITMKLGDLVGTNPLGGLGLGPVGMFNIGQM